MEEEANEEEDVLCSLDYQGGSEAGELPANCVGVRMPRLVFPVSGTLMSFDANGEEQNHRGGGAGACGLFGASHGARIRRDYEDRYAPRLHVHINGVAFASGEPVGEGGGGTNCFIRCRCISSSGAPGFGPNDTE